MICILNHISHITYHLIYYLSHNKVKNKRKLRSDTILILPFCEMIITIITLNKPFKRAINANRKSIK